MKIKKFLAGITAAASAFSFMAISVFAYDANTDFRTGWTVSTTVPASEFAEITEDSVITITYTADASLADVEGHDYWVIKPMFNDSGWPFIAGISGLTLSESGDSYSLDTDKTEASFTIPADSIEHLQTAGMALMGHGITLNTLTVSNDAASDISDDDTGNTEDEAAPEDTEEAAAEADDTASDDNSSDTTVETAAEAPVSDGNTTSAKTGNAHTAVCVCVMALAASAALAAKKR